MMMLGRRRWIRGQRTLLRGHHPFWVSKPEPSMISKAFLQPVLAWSVMAADKHDSDFFSTPGIPKHHLHDKLNSHKLVSVCTSISSYITLARKVPFLYSHATLMLATLKTPKPTLHRIQTPTCQWPIVPQNQLPSTIQMTQDRPIPQNQWPSTT